MLCVKYELFSILIMGKTRKNDDHILACNIGNLQHDTVVFVKRNEEKQYIFLHYDPNVDVSSDIVKSFIKEFGCNTQWFGYNSSSGNVEAKCTQYAWEEIFQFFILGKNPFLKDNIKIYSSVAKKYCSRSEMEVVGMNFKEYNNAVYNNTVRKS